MTRKHFKRKVLKQGTFIKTANKTKKVNMSRISRGGVRL